MNATESDATDTRAATTRPKRRVPRQNAGQGSATVRRGYAKAWAEFEARAHGWMRGRPGRTVTVPDDLARLAAAVGIPCRTCSAVVYRRGEGGHRIGWSWLPGSAHWTTGISADCDGD